jgi:hypothetical protein
VRLYRVTRNNPPIEEDMKSHWDLGRRPGRDKDEAAWKEVSTFETAELAAQKARLHGLGEYIAELEVPDDAPMTRKPSGHVGLAETTPDQLLGMVRNVRPLDEA